MSEFKTNKISPRKGTTQTIGDSGDTLSIPCGVTVTNAGTITTAGISGGTINNSGGTISGLRGQVEWDTTAKTTAFTAEANKGYFCNTTSAAFTVTLPASPSVGDVIAIKDYANTFDTNNLTLNANGNKIQGSTTNFDITVEGANSQFIYVDATRGWVLTDASKAADITEDIKYITATGGTVTTCGDFKIHSFTGPGTFCVSCAGNSAGSNTIDNLVVAGGGSVGGGGGGFRLLTCQSITASSFPITVGAGGATANPSGQGSKGSNSIFSTITSAGGGTGNPSSCGPGGSGGGTYSSNPFGTGNTPPVSPPQGNPGGSGVNDGNGGGGGAAAAGSNATSSGPTARGGAGGAGSPATPVFGAAPQPFYIPNVSGNGTTACGQFSGGGGGGGRGSYPTSSADGAGGIGGGSPGIRGGPGTIANATANSGGGGGSAVFCTTGGQGGSGIVIIRYKFQ
jgi:hypothetical protein